MHYYKRNLGDYAKKAGRLSMLQHGAYTLLTDSIYDREQFPNYDEAIDWTWASSREEVEAVEFVLKKFFVLEDGVYIQKRIQEEISAYHDQAEKNKEIALKREKAKRERKGNKACTERADSSTERAQVVQERTPNHKPLTTNQEPSNKTLDHFADRESDPPPDPPVAESVPDETDEAFNVFWFAGMRKLNKQKSIKSFKTALKKSKQPPMQFALMLADDVKRRLAVEQLGFADMHPTTYLNGQRWEDEIRPPSRASPSGRESMADQLTREAREREEFYATGITPEGVQVTQW